MNKEHRLETVEAVCQFLFAGNATVTLRSAKTGARFTFKVSEHKEKAGWHWVALMGGPDNEGDFRPLGYFSGPTFKVQQEGQPGRSLLPRLCLVRWQPGAGSAPGGAGSLPRGSLRGMWAQAHRPGVDLDRPWPRVLGPHRGREGQAH